MSDKFTLRNKGVLGDFHPLEGSKTNLQSWKIKGNTTTDNRN